MSVLVVAMPQSYKQLEFQVRSYGCLQPQILDNYWFDTI